MGTRAGSLKVPDIFKNYLDTIARTGVGFISMEQSFAMGQVYED